MILHSCEELMPPLDLHCWLVVGTTRETERTNEVQPEGAETKAMDAATTKINTKPVKTSWPFLYRTDRWWLCVWDARRSGGKIHRHKIGVVGLDDELTMARTAQEEVQRLKDGKGVKASPCPTIGDCWDLYSASLDDRQVATRDAIRSTWDRWTKDRDYTFGQPFQSVRVSELTIPGLQGWFHRLALDSSPSTSEKIRISLTAALRYAQRWIEGFPDMAVIPSSRVEQWRSDPRQVIIPLDRLGRVVSLLRADQEKDGNQEAKIRATKAAFVELVILTGLRMEELRQLRCRDLSPETIDGEEYLCIHVAKTKNGTAHLVPLVGRALAIIEEQLQRMPRKGDAFPVWMLKKDRSVPVSSQTILTYWKELQKAAGMPADCTIHDCRRTAASLMATAGEDLLDVELMLNHKTLTRVQGTYYRPQLGRMVAIFQKLGDLVEAKVGQYRKNHDAESMVDAAPKTEGEGTAIPSPSSKSDLQQEVNGGTSHGTERTVHSDSNCEPTSSNCRMRKKCSIAARSGVPKLRLHCKQPLQPLQPQRIKHAKHTRQTALELDRSCQSIQARCEGTGRHLD